MRASFIVRREVHFDLPPSAVEHKGYGLAGRGERYEVTLDVAQARSLLYALRDSLREAGEDV